MQNHPTYDALYHPPAGGGRENFGPSKVRIWVTTWKSEGFFLKLTLRCHGDHDQILWPIFKDFDEISTI